MIKTIRLTKHFSSLTAVDKVSLHVQKQEIFGLVGPDGAGKTTLLRMICGLIKPTSGQVLLMGRSLEELDAFRQDLGYMPQRFSLYGDLTVMENIDFLGAMYKLPKKVIDQRADEVLALTNLYDYKTRFADALSGGMKQKLALTCALITRPGLLVLDEPTYGVDPESRKEFWRILYKLNKDGMTIMVSTPYMDEAELCSKVAFISQGRIRTVDSPAQLKRDFTHSILEVRVASKDPNLFDGVSEILESSFYGDRFHVVVENADQSEITVKSYLTEKNVEISSIKKIAPTMEDLFVAFADREVG